MRSGGSGSSSAGVGRTSGVAANAKVRTGHRAVVEAGDAGDEALKLFGDHDIALASTKDATLVAIVFQLDVEGAAIRLGRAGENHVALGGVGFDDAEPVDAREIPDLAQILGSGAVARGVFLA